MINPSDVYFKLWYNQLQWYKMKYSPTNLPKKLTSQTTNKAGWHFTSSLKTQEFYMDNAVRHSLFSIKCPSHIYLAMKYLQYHHHNHRDNYQLLFLDCSCLITTPSKASILQQHNNAQSPCQEMEDEIRSLGNITLCTVNLRLPTFTWLIQCNIHFTIWWFSTPMYSYPPTNSMSPSTPLRSSLIMPGT
jgi:hypothetical protein